MLPLRPKKPVLAPFRICSELEYIYVYKYLGVDVDESLTYTNFAENVWNKVNYRLYNFSLIRPFLNENLACRIYKQTIMPLFEYASFILDSALKSLCNKLDNLQEKAMRLIHYKKIFVQGRRIYVDIDELYVKYNIEPLFVRRNQQLLCMIYNKSKKIDPQRNTNIERVTRSSTRVKFNLDFTQISRVLNSPMYRGISLWDSIPDYVQKVRSKYEFKRAIKLCSK